MTPQTTTRRRKGKPYDPGKLHDRRATETSIGLRDHLTTMEVDDPYEPGAKITVIRSRREDPLGDLHSRKMIDEAQYHAGRAFQRDFETAERGPQAIDPSKEWVDGGRIPEPISEPQRRAARQLTIVYRELGKNGSAVVHEVLILKRTRKQMAEIRGLEGKKWEEYLGSRFRECLDCMAVIYGFSNGKRTARADSNGARQMNRREGMTVNDLDQEAKRLCEAEGLLWERLSEEYESALNEYRSKTYFRCLAKKNNANGAS
jgi:hypothetical protein